MQQQNIDHEQALNEKNFFFSADNTFKQLETVAIKINGHKPVMAIINKKVMKDTYAVYVENNKDNELVVATKDIGKLIPQGPAKAEDFSFRAGNTFNTGETVAVKNEGGDLVYGIITMKQLFTKNRYVVRYVVPDVVPNRSEWTPYPASSIGKLKENMNVWERMKSKLYKPTQPKPNISKQIPEKGHPEHEARVELGFGAAAEITSEQLEKNYKIRIEEAKKVPDAAARKVREKLIQSSYNALKKAIDNVNQQLHRSTQDLLRAIQSGNFANVRKAIQEGADVNARDRYGNAIITLAISFRNAEAFINVVRLLLANGADINASDRAGNTTLHLVVHLYEVRDAMKIAAFLLANGANIDARDRAGNTILHVAIPYRSVDIIKQLLANEKIDINARNNDGLTALMIAADLKNAPIVELLLADKRIDVSDRDRDNFRALVRATSFKRNKDISGNEKRKMGKGPTKVLMQGNKKVTASTFLAEAVRKGDYSNVILALQAGADATVRDSLGRTPIKVAQLKNDNKMIKIIKEILKKDYAQAIENRDPDAVNKALRRGATIVIDDDLDDYGNTALHLLAGTRKAADEDTSLERAAFITELLLNAGAIIRKNRNGESPLDRAQRLPDSPIVEVYKKFVTVQAGRDKVYFDKVLSSITNKKLKG